MIDGQQLAKNIQAALDDVATFVTTAPFQKVLAEFSATPTARRGHFVRSVLINREELARRGVQVPEDMTIQRSAFEDDRPTLFCITKYLPDMGAARKKVTVTFDEAWEQSLEIPGFSADQLEGDTCFYEAIAPAGSAA
jgi:hypothetical protein